MPSLTVDIRTVYADQLAELLRAARDAIQQNAGRPGIAELRQACEQFAKADTFEVPRTKQTNN